MKNFTLTFFFAFLLTAISFAQNSEKLSDEILTTIEFEEDQFDFGTVTEGDKVTHIYRFKNTGDQPLLITNAKGSCGCTVPEWPNRPIMPGESGVIEVEFNTKGKSGRQSKRITITANTDPKQTFLTISGEVDKQEKPTMTKEEIPSIALPTFENKKLDTPKAKDCFAIFPNPTSDILKLDLREHVGKKANINILDAMGKKLDNKLSMEIQNEVIEFQVSHYPAVTYYVNIQIGEEVLTTKCFVVAKD